LTDTTRNKNS